MLVCSLWMILLYVRDALCYYTPGAFNDAIDNQLHQKDILIEFNNTTVKTKDRYKQPLEKFYYFTSCDYQGVRYPPGFFSPTPCVNCNCNATTGRVHCAFVDCPQRAADCIQYAPLTPGECCPKCVKRGCFHNGTAYAAGTKIVVGACEHCYCPWEGGGGEEGRGEPVCLKTQCPPVKCVDAVVPHGKCCPKCPNGANCWLDEQIIPASKRIYTDNCHFCECSNLKYVYDPEKRRATCVRSFFCI